MNDLSTGYRFLQLDLDPFHLHALGPTGSGDGIWWWFGWRWLGNIAMEKSSNMISFFSGFWHGMQYAVCSMQFAVPVKVSMPVFVICPYRMIRILGFKRKGSWNHSQDSLYKLATRWIEHGFLTYLKNQATHVQLSWLILWYRFGLQKRYNWAGFDSLETFS